MSTQIGDIYIRHSDGVAYRVKWVDIKIVVLESEDESLLSMTDIYSLEESYAKEESKLA